MLIIGADGFGALSTQPFSVMTGFDRFSGRGRGTAAESPSWDLFWRNFSQLSRGRAALSVCCAGRLAVYRRAPSSSSLRGVIPEVDANLCQKAGARYAYG